MSKQTMSGAQYLDAVVVPGERFDGDDSWWVVYEPEPDFYEHEGPFKSSDEAEEYIAYCLAAACGGGDGETMITAEEARCIRDGIHSMSIEQIENQIKGQAQRGQSQALFYPEELSPVARVILIMAGYVVDEREVGGFISVKWENITPSPRMRRKSLKQV